jgi:putrescine importer
MGRNKVLQPARLFGYVHPRLRTPVFSIVLVGVVSLLAITPSLELVASMINFGALVAFSFVNLAVIAHFAVRHRAIGSAQQVFRNLVLPGVGFVLTAVLWSFLHRDALLMGLSWAALGVVYALVLSKVTGRRFGEIELDEDPTKAYVGEPS